MKEDHIEVEGVISSVLAGTMFRVELDNKHMVLATICGKMRKRWVPFRRRSRKDGDVTLRLKQGANYLAPALICSPHS